MTNRHSAGTAALATSCSGTNEKAVSCATRAQDRGVVLAAAVRADAGVAGQSTEGRPVLYTGVVRRPVERFVDVPLPPSRDSSPASRTSGAASPTINALELLIRCGRQVAGEEDVR